jgi:hypothetical protein
MKPANQNPMTHLFAEKLQMSHRAAGIPDYITSVSKACDWINLRIKPHIGYGPWDKYLHDKRGERVPLVEKIIGISDALAIEQDDLLDPFSWKYNPAKNRSAEIGEWAMAKCYMLYTKYMDSFLETWKPSLIEWMLAVAIYDQYGEKRREVYQGAKDVYKAYRIIANNMRLAKLRRESAVKALDKFQAWYDEQTRALEAKRDAVTSIDEEIDSLAKEANEMMEKYGFIEKFEKERAESD